MSEPVWREGKPLSIQMIVPSLPRAGMEVVVTNLTLRLVELGHRVGVTCLETDGPLAETLRARGVDVKVVPAPGVSSNLRAPLLEAHLRSIRPDVVHSHSGVWLKAAHAARRAGVRRVVHTAHGLLSPEPWFAPTLMWAAARYTDAIVAVSRPLRGYLQRHCGRAKSRVCVIPNGVDTKRFARSEAPFMTAPPRHEFRLGHVARLESVKNQRLLIESFARVAAAEAEVILMIAGDGPLRGDLQAQADRLGLSDRVRFAGEVKDIPRWLQQLDAFVLSSDAEGTPMSILEALSTGVPVVSTAVGGIPDSLDNGRAGILVPPGDASALASAMLTVVRDTDQRAALAARGREWVQAEYSEESMVRRYEALYRGAAFSVARFEEAVSTCAE